MKIKTICGHCKKPIEKQKSRIKSDPTYCSKGCYYESMKYMLKGANNPNFGKRWNKSNRDRQGELTRERMKDPNARELAGSANRGVKFSKERVHKNAWTQN